MELAERVGMRSFFYSILLLNLSACAVPRDDSNKYGSMEVPATPGSFEPARGYEIRIEFPRGDDYIEEVEALLTITELATDGALKATGRARSGYGADVPWNGRLVGSNLELEAVHIETGSYQNAVVSFDLPAFSIDLKKPNDPVTLDGIVELGCGDCAFSIEEELTVRFGQDVTGAESILQQAQLLLKDQAKIWFDEPVERDVQVTATDDTGASIALDVSARPRDGMGTTELTVSPKTIWPNGKNLIRVRAMVDHAGNATDTQIFSFETPALPVADENLSFEGGTEGWRLEGCSTQANVVGITNEEIIPVSGGTFLVCSNLITRGLGFVHPHGASEVSVRIGMLHSYANDIQFRGSYSVSLFAPNGDVAGPVASTSQPAPVQGWTGFDVLTVPITQAMQAGFWLQIAASSDARFAGEGAPPQSVESPLIVDGVWLK